MRVARELEREYQAGYRVVGACLVDAPHDSVGSLDTGSRAIPLYGDIDDVLPALDASGADTVVITNTDELPGPRVRALSWQLTPGKQHLVVAPNLVDVAGPRLRMRPLTGLSLLHVETPRFSNGQRVLKRSMDMLVSGLGLLALAPLLCTVALLIRLDSPGPALFRQTRVGYHGREFTMYKFRSMSTDAETQLVKLRAAAHDAGNDILFKLRHDPRVTRIGGFMRRFSIDELPQLINVFRGDMSLVGPRPPLPREVAHYDQHVHRRFLVKPGITGLWQVSGRSNLTWTETVRLDLYYVENWSLAEDMLILGKTAKAVIAARGAY